MGKKHKKKSGKKGSAKAASERVGDPIIEDLRSAVEPVARLARSPLVAELVASALIAGAGALAKNPTGRAAEGEDESAEARVDGAHRGGRESADMIGLVAYSVAIAAGEIADRLARTFERSAGGGELAEQAADAARQAADAAWQVFAKDPA